jgi:K+/H+ antiporter YhaU regulatory subunit KhtT
VNVIAIHRALNEAIGADKTTETMELVPDPGYVFEKGDVLVLIGREENLTRLNKIDMDRD